jgi:hypothetical protein
MYTTTDIRIERIPLFIFLHVVFFNWIMRTVLRFSREQIQECNIHIIH